MSTELERKLAEAEKRLADAQFTDVSGLFNAMAGIVREVKSRRWICNSRGGYRYDDDEYRKEAGWALDAIEKRAQEAMSESNRRMAALSAPAAKTSDGCDEEFLPTPENINALPEPLRKYIHDLEARCDPAGDVAALTLTRDQNQQLRAALTERETRAVSLKETIRKMSGFALQGIHEPDSRKYCEAIREAAISAGVSTALPSVTKESDEATFAPRLLIGPDASTVKNLAMLVRRMASLLRGRPIAAQAWRYLCSKGLQGSPLREDDHEPDPSPEDGLSFRRWQRINVVRCAEAFAHDVDGWNLLEWAGATAGEVGEVANVCKKIRRIETNTGGKWSKKDPPLPELKAKLADEIGDVLAYLALLAEAAGLDMGACAAGKFDKVSDAAEWPGERLVAATAAQEKGGEE